MSATLSDIELALAKWVAQLLNDADRCERRNGLIGLLTGCPCGHYKDFTKGETKCLSY
jgi:hypothetical protein